MHIFFSNKDILILIVSKNKALIFNFSKEKFKKIREFCNNIFQVITFLDKI